MLRIAMESWRLDEEAIVKEWLVWPVQKLSAAKAKGAGQANLFLSSRTLSYM